jgi:hypothetical protein
MKRAFYFSLAAAAALGFTASAWAQAAGGAGGSAGAGASGSAGAGASGSGAGAANTAGVGGNAGTNVGNGGRAGVPGANNGVGASNGLGANNGVNTNNNNVNTGVNSRSAFGNTGTSGRTNGNTGGNRSNLNPNAGETGSNGNTGGNRSNLNPNAGEMGANGGISQNPFFSNPAVRQQLKMNDTQFNSLNRAYQDAYKNYNTSLNGLGQNLTADQRNQKLEMLQNQFNDRFNQNVNSTLTDSAARTRFEQLNRQYMGLSNFNNPAIQKQLNLTPTQMNQIRQLATGMRSQESNPNGTNGQNQYSQTWERINSILTPEQQQTWSQLTGERFDFGNAGSGRDGTAQSGFGTGASQAQNGSTINGGNAGNQNTDPSNNLTAPRPGRGLVPTGGTSGSAAGSGTGNSGNQGSTGSSTSAGDANGAGTGDAGTGAGSGTGSTTTGGSSSSK